MGKKKLINLAKELDFETEIEYFDYIINSYINGQKTQTRALYKAMKEVDKLEFLVYLKEYSLNDEIFNSVITTLKINL